MDSKTSIVQIIVLGVFIIFGVTGVLFFARYGGTGGGNTDTSATITLWGVLSRDKFTQTVDRVNQENPGLLKINYVEKDPNTLEEELEEAIIDGEAPDALLVSDDFIPKNQNKFTLINYSIYSERDFKDRFAEAGEVFVSPEGVYAIPFLIDPFIAFWNRDIFSNKSVALPPKTWEEFISLIPTFTSVEENKRITKSIAPIGEYANIKNTKPFFLTLLNQSGTKGVSRTTDSFKNETALSIFDSTSLTNPLSISLEFFKQFSDPVKPTYIWNRSLPDAETMFIKGDLAMYFGFGSEIPYIRSKNPNLNFDVSEIPQSKSTNRKATFGRVYGLVIVKSSPYQQDALNTFVALTKPNVNQVFADSFVIAPSLRSLLNNKKEMAFEDVLYKSAVYAKGFVDLNPIETSLAIKNMVESVNTGKNSVNQATQILNRQIDELIRQ